MDEEMEKALAEYQAEQDALPPHQRDGYAERMREQADMERKRDKGE